MGREDCTDTLDFLEREGVERMVGDVGGVLAAGASRGVEPVGNEVGFGFGGAAPWGETSAVEKRRLVVGKIREV